MMDWLDMTKHELLTQDNRITSHPIFLVQQRYRIYGIGPDYTEDFVWINSDGNELSVVDPGSDDVTKVGIRDIWEFVSCFFTNKAAVEFIEANRHRLTEPRIYVHSGYRNYEWQRVRALLMGSPHPENP